MNRNVQVAGQLIREPFPGMQDAVANPVFVQELKKCAETGGEAPVLWGGRLDASGPTTGGD